MPLIKCPFCAEEIQAEATKCRHCGEFLNKRVSISKPDAAVDSSTRYLKEGTELGLSFLDSVNSQSAVVGDRINLTLEHDIREGDYILAKAGAMAVGSVSHVKRTGMLGRGAELNVRLDYLKTGNTRVPLRASAGQQGKNKTGATIGLSLLFGPFGLMKRGSNVVIPQGAQVYGYIDEDTAIHAEYSPPEFFCKNCGTRLSAAGATSAKCGNTLRTKDIHPDTREVATNWAATFVGIGIVIVLVLVIMLIANSGKSQPTANEAPLSPPASAPMGQVVVQTPEIDLPKILGKNKHDVEAVIGRASSYPVKSPGTAKYPWGELQYKNGRLVALEYHYKQHPSSTAQALRLLGLQQTSAPDVFQSVYQWNSWIRGMHPLVCCGFTFEDNRLARDFTHIDVVLEGD